MLGSSMSRADGERSPRIRSQHVQLVLERVDCTLQIVERHAPRGEPENAVSIGSRG